MLIGIVYGGTGEEELYNLPVVKDIEEVFDSCKLSSRRIYLNKKSLPLSLLEGIDLFFIVDSFCKNISNRKLVFNYIKKNKIDYIGQNEKAFLIARDKYKTNKILNKNGILTPKSFLISNNSDILSFKKSFSEKNGFCLNTKFPLIVKDNFGSSSQHLEVCFERKKLFHTIENLLKKCKKLIIEEYIDGMEVTSPFLEIFGKKIVLNSLEIVYDGYVYDRRIKIKEENYLKIPPRINGKLLEEIKRITLVANRSIGCRFYSRMDIKIKKGKVYVLEINGEPVLSKNDFIGRSAKSLGIEYETVILGLLSNSKTFRKLSKDNPLLLA